MLQSHLCVWGMKLDNVPASLQLQSGFLDITTGVAPFQLDWHAATFGDVAQANVDIGTTAARVAAAAIDLRDQFMAVWQAHGGGGAEGRPAWGVAARMAGAFGQGSWLLSCDWEQQVQSEESSGVRRFIVEKEGGLPLVGENEIEAAVAIDIGQSNAFADHRFGEPDFGSDVIVPPIGGADKERIRIVAAQVSAGFEVGPESWIVNDAIVTGAQGLQLGPAINVAFDKANGLDGFKHTVVVEIG